VCERRAASSIEGERFVVVIHGKPLKAPSFNAILQGDVKIFDFPTPTKLQAGTTNKLMLSSSHPGPTVVEIFSKPEMRKNSKESLTEVNRHDNLKNIIRV
jgi:shikimate kinase